MKKVTIRDIARGCDVSTTTVSRVLNNIEGACTPETKERILAFVEATHYRPNPMARSLVTQKTYLVGVILPDIYNQFFQEYFRGAEDHLSSRGYKLILCNTAGKTEKEVDYLTSLSDGIVDGIMITTNNGVDDNALIQELHKRKFPIVLAERYGEGLEEIPRVYVNNKDAIYRAVQHLYQLGHRDIAFIKGPSGAYNARLRFEGYLAGLESVGLPIRTELIFRGDYQRDMAYKAVARGLKNTSFSALISANDLMAIGACRAISETGLTIPKDVSVIGLDGTLMAQLHQPPLCTFSNSGYEMGKLCARKLLLTIQEKPIKVKETMFETTLIPGESVCHRKDG